MSSENIPVSTAQRPELVFALVGGAGVHLNGLSEELKKALAEFGYQTVDIRLSELLKRFSGWTTITVRNEYDRIRHLQAMGKEFRIKLQRGDALALAAVNEIRAERAKRSRNPDIPVQAQAYILRQLKHPEEAELLRKIYGPSFFLIAGHAPNSNRSEILKNQIAHDEAKPGQEAQYAGEASKIIAIDDKEDDDFGQNVRDTYPKADFFANLGIPLGQNEIQRFLYLIFGHPFYAPRHDEFAMYLANAASLKSSDENRQVGAVIASLSWYEEHGRKIIKNADIISVGMNEVPRAGGGSYSDYDSPDCRDQKLFQSGVDRAFDIKISALTELIERILPMKWMNETISGRTPLDLAHELIPNLKGSQFLNIGEFSRPVHAEMAAIIDAARRGVAVKDHSMYVTTFPCHNCAKHIIAAGICRVVYLEPYPKSRADYLHKEELYLESQFGTEEKNKVVFFPFTGIAPRQYHQLFSMSERGAKKGNSLTEWESKRDLHALAPLYVPNNASSLYVESEKQELIALKPDIYSIL